MKERPASSIDAVSDLHVRIGCPEIQRSEASRDFQSAPQFVFIEAQGLRSDI